MLSLPSLPIEMPNPVVRFGSEDAKTEGGVLELVFTRCTLDIFEVAFGFLRFSTSVAGYPSRTPYANQHCMLPERQRCIPLFASHCLLHAPDEGKLGRFAGQS